MGKETMEIINKLSESVEHLKQDIAKENQLTHGDCVRLFSNEEMTKFFHNMFYQEFTVKQLSAFLDKPYIPG